MYVYAGIVLSFFCFCSEHGSVVALYGSRKYIISILRWDIFTVDFVKINKLKLYETLTIKYWNILYTFFYQLSPSRLSKLLVQNNGNINKCKIDAV